MSLADRHVTSSALAGRPAPVPVVLVHYHVYKNAGSSVDRAIREAVGTDSFMELDKDRGFRRAPAFNAALVRQILHGHPGIRGFTSHTFIPTVHRCNDFVALPIVFLRHPLLRLASVFRFEAISAAHKDTPSGKLAQSAAFPEWLDAYLGMHNGKNYQTCVLSMMEDGSHSPFTNGHPRHIGDIRVAAERLDEVNSLTGVGIVEQFDRSARRIEAAVGRHFPGFRLSGAAANQTKQVDSWQDELAALERSLPADLLARAVMANASDYALYDRYR
ncbi:hypothetical protein BV509_02545 [Rhodovulum sulfidophilum]|uniref:Sulfotransferase family 2 domain-containing protein n=1 Tax=Rhodovulum visakhapatnamense TaxID=364297 RepID=A0ABS1RG05_9RHOB|nr:sulfotransferase family 2 domain-containing protein [Rhodovulum sp. BSW8]MBL3570679.1 sulfotransferase family 2 domain-containing protein [Rhodovulum visakhapatnamense]MBL3577681.1 sulfotransferase family 2 domain-containing protein [Rhodovulum visakhapatnamense]OLS43320.1 hypothetical protein BV509_02545 [Rhodovulum sulfidophilum]